MKLCILPKQLLFTFMPVVVGLDIVAFFNYISAPETIYKKMKGKLSLIIEG